MLLKQITQSTLPTLWGNFLLIGFQEINSTKNHIALIYGNSNNKKIPISNNKNSFIMFNWRCII